MTTSPAPEDIARRLFESLRRSYPDQDVEIKMFKSTVTISRGRRAAQVSVVDEKTFRLAWRKRDTFHMIKDPVDQEGMAEIIREMIGE